MSGITVRRWCAQHRGEHLSLDARQHPCLNLIALSGAPRGRSSSGTQLPRVSSRHPSSLLTAVPETQMLLPGSREVVPG
jgi:hypothetical protein